MESLVDTGEREGMGDELVELERSSHVLVDHARELGATLGAAKGRAHPDAAGDQLEGAGGDLGAGGGDADDDGLAPPLVAHLEGLAHDVDVADALEGVVDAADAVVVGHGDDVADESVAASGDLGGGSE